MKNNQKIFNHIDLTEYLDDEKTESLIAFVNRGIAIYNNYYCLNPEVQELGQQRHMIKNLLKTQLTISDIKKITSELKKIEFSRRILVWRSDNAERLDNEDIVNELLDQAFSDCTDDLKKLLIQYQQGSSYVLHTAQALIELAEELLPSLEFYVGVLLKKVSKKSSLFSQIEDLQKELRSEKARIAAAMVLRIEAAFFYQDLNQDDALVYVYHQLIKSGALKHDAPLQIPQGSLTVELLSQFYNYIQDNGSEVTKARLNGVINDDSFVLSNSLKIEDRVIDKKIIKIPFQLRTYVPVKQPWFGWGAKLRHHFFKQHAGLLMMIKSYSRWEEQHHPHSNVSLLLTMRHDIRNHQKELDTLYESMKGIKGLFLGKTKRFLAHWEDILIKEEDRSWQRHYASLTRQAEDYLRYPAESSGKTQKNLFDHLSLLIVEIKEFGPSFTQAFLPQLTHLKKQLDPESSEDEQLMMDLDHQIETSKQLLADEGIRSRSNYDDRSITFDDIAQMEQQLIACDEEDVNAQDEHIPISDVRKAQITAWGQGIFTSNEIEPFSDDEQLSPSHRLRIGSTGNES